MAAVVATMRGWPAGRTCRSGRASRLASRLPPPSRCSLSVWASSSQDWSRMVCRSLSAAARQAGIGPGRPSRSPMAAARSRATWPLAADLPDALVRLPPGLPGHVGQLAQPRPQLRLEPAAAADPLVRAVEYLAIDIVLALVGRAVAPSHRG